MKRVIVAIACAALLLIASVIGAQDTDPVIVVDANTIIREIPPTVYGANFGPLNTIPADLFEQAAASGIRLWRFPGGRVGDLSDIQRSQLDLLVIQARAFGIEPIVSVRLEGGTPQAAADLVRYANIEKGYGIKIWSIGNEPDLFDDYTPDQHTREWRAIADAMRAVDPSILLAGPDTSQFTGADTGNERAHEFLRHFLETNGDQVDIVTVHRYPFGEPVATIDTLRADAPTWSALINNLKQWTRDLTGRDLPVGVMEANSHWSPQISGEATPDSHMNAVWWADALGRLIVGGADYVAYFNMQTSDRLGGHGLLARYEVRPTYYTYQLYRQWGDRLVSAQAADGDTVSAYAALRADGALTVLLVNLTDESQKRALNLEGFAPASADALVLDEQLNAEPAPGVVTQIGGSSLTVTLSPRSATLVIITSTTP